MCVWGSSCVGMLLYIESARPGSPPYCSCVQYCTGVQCVHFDTVQVFSVDVETRGIDVVLNARPVWTEGHRIGVSCWSGVQFMDPDRREGPQLRRYGLCARF